MIEFGKTLKAAREAKGLSTNDVAKATHVMIQIVEGFEREDFSRIPAPIYGRGFVKLCCETVGIDPQPMIAQYMNLISGKRHQAARGALQRQQPQAPAARRPAFPEPSSAADCKPDAGQPLPAKPATSANNRFAMEAERILHRATSPAGKGNDASAPSSAARHGLSAIAKFDWFGLPLRLSPQMRKLMLILVGAAMLLGLVISCIKAGLRGGDESPVAAETEETVAPEEESPVATAPTAAETGTASPAREPQKIPPLYID